MQLRFGTAGQDRGAALACSFRIFTKSSSRAFEPAAWAAWNVGKPPPVSFTLNGVLRRWIFHL